MEKIVFSIAGMHCEHCVKAITTALHAMPGVSFVNVCLEANDVIVEFDPHICTMNAVKATVEEQGYQVRLIPG